MGEGGQIRMDSALGVDLISFRKVLVGNSVTSEEINKLTDKDLLDILMYIVSNT